MILAGLLEDTWPEPTLVLTSLPIPAADSHPLQHDAATSAIHCGDGIPYLVLTRFSTGGHLAFRPNQFFAPSCSQNPTTSIWQSPDGLSHSGHWVCLLTETPMTFTEIGHMVTSRVLTQPCHRSA